MNHFKAIGRALLVLQPFTTLYTSVTVGLLVYLIITGATALAVVLAGILGGTTIYYQGVRRAVAEDLERQEDVVLLLKAAIRGGKERPRFEN